MLAQMLGGLHRYSDAEIAGLGVEPAGLRDRIAAWAADLTSSREDDGDLGRDTPAG